MRGARRVERGSGAALERAGAGVGCTAAQAQGGVASLIVVGIYEGDGASLARRAGGGR